MSLEDPPFDPSEDLPAQEDLELSPPAHLDAPIEADEADVLEQSLEVPPPGDEA